MAGCIVHKNIDSTNDENAFEISMCSDPVLCTACKIFKFRQSYSFNSHLISQYSVVCIVIHTLAFRNTYHGLSSYTPLIIVTDYPVDMLIRGFQVEDNQKLTSIETNYMNKSHPMYEFCYISMTPSSARMSYLTWRDS